MNKRLAMQLKGNKHRHMVPPMHIAHARNHRDQWVTVACVEGDSWSTRYTEKAVGIIEAAIEGRKLPGGVREARAIASFLAELNEVLTAAHLARWPLKLEVPNE